MYSKEKINYYLDIAQEAMQLGTCLRHNCGAAIILKDCIISTGQNHIIRKNEKKTNDKTLYLDCRVQENVPKIKGMCYGGCKVAHAEITAIINSQIKSLRGATIFLVGSYVETGELIKDVQPCGVCLHHIIRSGIAEVVCRTSPTEFRVIDLNGNSK